MTSVVSRMKGRGEMKKSRSGRIGVIGGGLGGLASACTLAARGYEVALYEKNPWLGGKAAGLAEAGYRFDMGPTILLMPSVLRRIFAEAGRDLEDELELIPLDPQWRSFFEGGSTLDLHADPGRMTRTLDAFAPGGKDSLGYRKFLDLSKRLDDISQRYFFWRSIGSVRDMFDPSTAASLSTLGDVMAMRPWSTVGATIRSHVGDPRVSQMLDHFTQYVGSAPDLSPAVLCGIAHMQTSEGIWYPRGGTRAVAEALMRLAEGLGVELHTGSDVRSIRTGRDGSVSGIELDDGRRVDLAAVVSNCDSVRTHRELMAGTPAAARFEKRRGYEAACSGVVLYLGLDRRYDQLLHHNFVFSRDPHEEFDVIYRKGEPAPDPTCYVCAPAATEPDVAPPGGEALYVLVHTPYLRPHHDWKSMYPRYRQTILDKLKSTAGLSDIERRIKVERWLTPQDIHDRYRVLDGAIYGLASHGRFGGAFKPANRSPDVERLYLAGGAAHPGPGMPMVMMSGWIAADTLDRDGLVEQARERISEAGAAPSHAGTV
jgi:diapolycopene oxygenase